MLSFEFLNGIPHDWIKAIFIITFFIVLILVFFLPKLYVTQGVKNPRWYHNLKIWTTVVIGILSLLHIIF